VLIGAVSVIATRRATAELDRAATERLMSSGLRAAGLVSQYVSERWEDLRLLVDVPSLYTGARLAGDRAAQLGLDRLTTEALEARFESTRALGADSSVLAVMLGIQRRTDFAEIFYTDRHGFNVLATNRTSDFVQSDEDWWQRAMEDGEFQSPPQFDESAGVVALELSIRVDDPATGNRLGVLKAVVQLSRLAHLLAVGGQTGTSVEVIDSTGRIIVARDAGRLLQTASSIERIPRQPTPQVVTRPGSGGDELVASIPAEGGRWWVLAVQPVELARAAADAITQSMVITGGIVMIVTLLALLSLTSWLDRRVTNPVRSAGAVAQRIADGDLAVQVGTLHRGTDEVGDLLQAIDRMVVALRTLVGAIRSSSEESAAMAEQISASTQEMSASAQEMATTCQHLTQQASEQAALIRKTATDADRILEIASTLADGTTTAASRNADLQQIADNHRRRLEESSEQLGQLADEISRGSQEAEQLARMSAEIQEFIGQTRSIAAQTNMLALNAAIEASRAEGGDGRGFGVVADEVRKLAGQAARAAAITSETVGKVLQTVQTTHDRLNRIAEGSNAVRDVAQSAAQALKEVSDAASENSVWSEEISRSADQERELVAEISVRLKSLASGTESFLAAAEEIAATAEEQTASAEEIASSAGQLAEASERLTANVSSFRLMGGESSNGK
jgi:methyl-accepting chemotaxis protein